MVLVASIVGVLVVGGGLTAVVMNNKKAGADTTGGKQAGVPPVTDDTAKKGGTSNPVGGKQASRPDTVRSNGQATNLQTQTTLAGNQTRSGTGVDSARISAELEKLNDDLDDDAKAGSVPQRAIAIYSSATYPKNLRAEAAFLASVAYAGQGKTDESCRWASNALIQRPGWDVASKHQQRLACP